ncbi:hypothetical protein [Archaeoglobus neptunius]|uniref:hypothetical protein n=1 Tax=Archaeoglobus neptunius TaxID=2798580 RepID=UPI00192631E1|nr:hypothetical protein [Archaeoglobus neptunius]
MNLIPRMGGAWSIWLASTIMGLKFFSIEGLTASLLVLLSVNSLLDKRPGKRGRVFLLMLAALITFGIFKNSDFLVVVIPYSLLFAINRLTSSQRLFIVTGSLLLTFPFPLMAGLSGEISLKILSPLVLLISLTIFNLLTAESAIFRKRTDWRNYLSLTVLSSLFYILAPVFVFAAVTACSLFVLIFSSRITLKKLGFSLLGLHLLYAVTYLIYID